MNHRLSTNSVTYAPLQTCSLQDDGEAEIRSIDDIVNQIEAELSSLEVQMRERDDEIKGLQTEKDLQSNGEVKELMQVADELSKR